MLPSVIAISVAYGIFGLTMLYIFVITNLKDVMLLAISKSPEVI